MSYAYVMNREIKTGCGSNTTVWIDNIGDWWWKISLNFIIIYWLFYFYYTLEVKSTTSVRISVSAQKISLKIHSSSQGTLTHIFTHSKRTNRIWPISCGWHRFWEIFSSLIYRSKNAFLFYSHSFEFDIILSVRIYPWFG